ncbi:MAG TPA: AsmA-like C-terminal region-containing protein, partial [Candidatus Acidoferrales bacterium]|nr:AsmA-like C-terminal region-containing protein [Candidatus Acidoferrales bacterium]
EVLGGKHQGEWAADFSATPAPCHGSGTLTGIALSQAADLMKDSWISGTTKAEYELSGACGAEFWQSAEGMVQFDVTSGSLPRISLGEGEGPLRFVHLAGLAHLQVGKFEVKDARLDSTSGRYELSGTASLKRELALKLAAVPAGSRAGYAITGTLAQPRVVPLPGAEQARLKPEPAK